MAGKGDTRRKSNISLKEEDLRWELIQTKNKKRKKQILKELEKIKN